MHAVAAIACALVPLLDTEPVPFSLEVPGDLPLTGVLHFAPTGADLPFHDLATVIAVADVGDIHVQLETLVNPVLGRRMNLVVLDATRRDLSPLLAWLAARELDTSRLGWVAFGEGVDAVAATRAAHPGAVRAAMLISPDPKQLEAADWLETPLFLYEAGDARGALGETIRALQPGGRVGTRLPEAGPRGSAFLDGLGNPPLLASWMRDLLTRNAYLTVPAYPQGDQRVQAPGFLGQVQRIGRQRGASTFELMTWCVGEVWTVGAMVHGTFAGRVTFELEGHEYDLALETEDPPADGVAVLRNGEPCDLIGVAGSDQGWSWIQLELPRPLENAQLALRYHPRDGEPLRLPGEGAHFGVHLSGR